MAVTDLLDLLRGREELADLDAAERRLALRTVVNERGDALDRPTAVAELADWIDGFGPLTRLMSDPAVTDILLNGPHEVWVERDGTLQQHPPVFESAGELLDLIERLMAEGGARVDGRVPIGDAQLRDGSRFHVVLPPVAPHGPLVSIRRFPAHGFTLDDLARTRFMTDDVADVLQRCVLDRRSIVIGGATGTGKTTLANALLGCIPETERIVVIEETRELSPACRHWVSLTTRMTNVEGKGALEQTDLLRAALRMRPDRIVVGEVRGGEAAVAIQAMSTGHDGSILTVHSRSALEVTDRLVELALMNPTAPREPSLYRQVKRAVDVVVQLGRSGGRRMLVEVVRV